jgi:single-stranded-DNA-specific exonuclease
LPTEPRSVPRAWCPRTPDSQLVAQLARALDLEPLVAGVLASRGVRSEEDAGRFLEPSVDHLLDPLAMADMPRAAERIARAVRDRERILVYGDYDVDGLSSTALMMQFLRYLGADPGVYVPNRAYEGYSFTTGGVSSILQSGAKVVVSVDNGIASFAPVGELAAAGVDVIITDHHLPSAELPPAYAIVNPRRADCAYPFKGLAGVGVAFKVACAVAGQLSEAKRRSPEMARFLGEAMAWVALGTLSDMVPLIGENRVLAARGLAAIPKSTSPGLRALCKVAEIRGDAFSAEDVAFKLAPRLNAAGRLGRSDLSLALLTERDPAEAERLAKHLDELNVQRRQLDRAMFLSVQGELGKLCADDPVVLHSDAWTTGLLGLVAGRIASQTGRPAALISGRNGSPAKGSCRSVPGFDLHAALQECTEHLVQHGGHAMAAGFSVHVERVAGFKAAFSQAWRRHRAQAGGPPPLEYDGELPLAALTPRLLGQIERLAPFGEGNRRPVVGARAVTVLQSHRMGSDKSHLSLEVGQGPATLRAVAFGRGELAEKLPRGAMADLLFVPKFNTFRGRSSVELELVDLRGTDVDGGLPLSMDLPAGELA